jgi:protein O-GlcNAc transferase
LGLAKIGQPARLAPRRAVIHLTIGRAHLALKRPTEAEGAFREAVRLGASLTAARVELANLLVATGRPQEAEELLSAGLRAAPGDDDLEATLGLAYSAQARWAEAAQTLSRVVERSPRHRAALRNLVQVENRLKRADRVVSLAARYLALDPDDAGIRSTYLMTRLYVSGDAEEMLHLACRWAGARTGGPPPAPPRHANSPDPERRLRVGFVSCPRCARPTRRRPGPLTRRQGRSRSARTGRRASGTWDTGLFASRHLGAPSLPSCPPAHEIPVRPLLLCERSLTGPWPWQVLP